MIPFTTHLLFINKIENLNKYLRYETAFIDKIKVEIRMEDLL